MKAAVNVVLADGMEKRAYLCLDRSIFSQLDESVGLTECGIGSRFHFKRAEQKRTITRVFRVGSLSVSRFEFRSE